MADSDLIFSLPYDASFPANLVFGDDGTPSVPDTTVLVRGKMHALKGRLRTSIAKDVIVRGSMHRLRGQVATQYRTDTQRPVVNRTRGRFEIALEERTGTRPTWTEADRLHPSVHAKFQAADPLSVDTRLRWQEGDPIHESAQARFQQAIRLNTAATWARYQDGLRRHVIDRARYQEALRLNTGATWVRYQDGLRDRRNFTAVRFQEAIPYFATWTEQGGTADPLRTGWRVRYQEARKPPMGMWIPPEPPEPDPCYIPELPAHLVFVDPWTGSPNLLFICDRHEPPEPGETIVVPVKEVYLTINSAVLVRLDNGHFIPTTAMSMSLDVDSWTWSFSAAIPGSALDEVKPASDGTLVLVQATINGTAYRFAIEKITRDRTFNSSQLRVNGRGIAAELDGPYAPQMSFGNTQPRNARQLLDDILTYNNVPIGWNIGTFEPTDWAVPAGVFSHVGSYISALNAVVGAAGAYMQPHNTARTMDVRLRYPVPSWQWSIVTPQFELPAAVTTQEGFEWTDKPKYNRVFVSGQEHGILGQYTRTGTAGDLVAPTVVDPLITHADAARQRGRAIISDTGRIATVTLRLPVLAETGIIKPGNFVHYVEGGNTHIGLTRGVSVAVGLPTIYQTLTVETHVEPV